MAVQPPTGPPKPPPDGEGKVYMESVLFSQLTPEQKVDLLKEWVKELKEDKKE